MKKLLALFLTLLLMPAAALGETVVTSFYPIYLFTLNLLEGVDGVEVRNLAAPGTGCLHDYQLSTGDMKALANADVFLINGAGMESYLAFAMEAFPELQVVDASQGIELLAEGGLDNHDDLDGQDNQDGQGDHDHDHGDFNAHIWLDAENAQQMVRNLAQGLMEACPAQAEAIAANRDAYLARLSALDKELTEGLQAVAGKEIITFHEAFPYFAKAYGLTVAAVVAREPDTALSPRELAGLVALIREKGNPPLFTEPQYEDAAAKTLSQETGAPIYTLDPVVTGPDSSIPLTLYEDSMRHNMQVLLEALDKKP